MEPCSSVVISMTTLVAFHIVTMVRYLQLLPVSVVSMDGFVRTIGDPSSWSGWIAWLSLVR